MHVLIVTDSYPPQPDGHAVSVAWWEQALRSAGHSVSVSTPRQLRLREQPDVLFVHGYGLRTAAVIAAYPRAPIVSFVHRHAYLDVPFLFPRISWLHTWLAARLYQRQKRFLEYSAHVFAPSERTAHITRAMTSRVPISVAITGVGPLFRAAAGTARPITPPKVLYVGRRSPDKNFTSLIPLAARRPDWQWHAIGAAGPDDDAAADAGFILTGHLSPAEVVGTIQEASVLLLPSEQETQGLAALEALTIGVPVVAPAGSAQAELIAVGESGETYEYGAPAEAVIGAIERAMTLAPLRVMPDQEEVSIAHVLSVLERVRRFP